MKLLTHMRIMQRHQGTAFHAVQCIKKIVFEKHFTFQMRFIMTHITCLETCLFISLFGTSAEVLTQNAPGTIQLLLDGKPKKGEASQVEPVSYGGKALFSEPDFENTNLL